MKAISLWQPWASLWLSDRKVNETRHWELPTTVTLPSVIAVHAAKTDKAMHPSYHSPELRKILTSEFTSLWTGLPLGALLGVVELIDCRPTKGLYTETRPGLAPDDYWCGNFGPGRFAWTRGRYARLRNPLPCTGRQGFFNVPEELERIIRREVLWMP